MAAAKRGADSSEITVDPVAAVPLPSADLIRYFMKETKDGFEGVGEALKDLDRKLDKRLDQMSQGFVTKQDSDQKRKEIDDRLEDVDETQKTHGEAIKGLTKLVDQITGAVKLLKAISAILATVSLVLMIMYYLHMR